MSSDSKTSASKNVYKIDSKHTKKLVELMN